MGDDMRTGPVWADGGPTFGVEVSSEAVRSWVTLSGELDLASAPYLQQILDQLCRDGFPEVVLDLAGLKFLGVVGLEVFLRADDQLRATGGRLILNRPGRLVRRVLAITELDTVLTIWGGRLRAVSIARPPAGSAGCPDGRPAAPRAGDLGCRHW
jgi:anti-sigma B factor antagonist